LFAVEVMVVDEKDEPVETGQSGEVVIRGHNVMKGYYKRPDDTAEAMRNGWFHTGDIGILDADGYLSIVDRKKDMILRGGFSVYPREIEEVMLTHPDVSLVAVIGVPDERLGEEVKAFVVRKPGGQITEDALRDWCHEQLPLALPARAAQLARAAGLRTAQLSYSYLTLHAADRSLAELAPGVAAYRVVSAPLRSKGKLELLVCGQHPTRRLQRLDRHASEANAAFDALQRGSVVQLLTDASAEAALVRVDARTGVRVLSAVDAPAADDHDGMC